MFVCLLYIVYIIYAISQKARIRSRKLVSFYYRLLLLVLPISFCQRSTSGKPIVSGTADSVGTLSVHDPHAVSDSLFFLLVSSFAD